MLKSGIQCKESLLWRQSQSVARQPFASALKWTKGHNVQWHRRLSEEIRQVTHGSPQPSRQKPKTEMESSRRDMWRRVLSYGRNPRNEQRRLTRIFPETVIPAEHHHLRLKGTRADKMKEDKQTKIPHTGNRLIKILRCRYTLPFLKKEGWLQG